MSYVYVELPSGHFVVGFYAPEHVGGGGWVSESHHVDREDAAARVHYLNGGATGGAARRKEP